MAPTVTSTAPSTRFITAFAPTEDRDPFQIRFEIDQKLPKELRAEAQGMDWGLFKATYAPTQTMHIGLTNIEKLNWSDHHYTAENTHTSKTKSPTTTVCEVTATGQTAAISEILSSNGRYVEILAFHQINLFEATLTCVKVAHQVNHNRTAWAVGFGHNAPGGGFAGGLVAALAFALRYLADGRKEVEDALPVNPEAILGTGLILSSSAVVITMFFGLPPLTTAYIATEVPLIGSVSLPSALLFDAGVYVIVIGLIMHILNSVGGYLDREEEDRKARARQRARELLQKNEKRRAEQRSRRAARLPDGAGLSGGALVDAPQRTSTLESKGD